MRKFTHVKFELRLCQVSRPTSLLRFASVHTACQYNFFPLCLHLLSDNYYIYMEASYGRMGSTFRLISPTVNATAMQCFSFWYHMYGSHINTLNVKLTGAGNLTVWSRNGTQGNQWHQANITLGGSSYAGYNKVNLALLNYGMLEHKHYIFIIKSNI